MTSILDLLFDPSKKQRKRRTLIYGVEGIGKSTLASQWPTAIFIPTEDGLVNISCKSLPQVKTFDEFRNTVKMIRDAPSLGPAQTLVIDTITGLDALIKQYVDEQYSEKERGYGRDYDLCANEWRTVLDVLEMIGIQKNLHIVLVGHCELKKVDSANGASWQKFMPRLHEKTSAPIREWCDEVLFARQRIFTAEKEVGFKQVKTVASQGQRVLFCCEKPEHAAKNRLGIEAEYIEMSYAALSAYYPKSETGNISGVVVGGSSKKEESNG